MIMWMAAGLVVAAVLVSIVLRRGRTTATVRGNSMAPTYLDGARVIATRAPEYHPGDVVVFRVPAPVRGDPPYRIKRIAATAGEPTPVWMDAAPTVPAGHVVVVGDNPHSQDSRHLGYIPLTSIAGRVTRVLPTRRASARAT